MEDYPNSCAVLVRRHGIYVWVIILLVAIMFILIQK